jgi:hypothetical protein
MGARLRVVLNPEENWALFELRRATTVPQRGKDCAEVVRLSYQGMSVEMIATFFNWNIQTVRDTLHLWQLAQGPFTQQQTVDLEAEEKKAAIPGLLQYAQTVVSSVQQQRYLEYACAVTGTIQSYPDLYQEYVGSRRVGTAHQP